MRSCSSVTPLGKSNAADFLKEYLKTHHPDIPRRVIAAESADLSAVIEPEIQTLAKWAHDPNLPAGVLCNQN